MQTQAHVIACLIYQSLPIPHHRKARVDDVESMIKEGVIEKHPPNELDTESQALAVFLANNKLYRYTRLIMGVKPAQAELNAALKLIFSHISNVYLIHDDLIIATKSMKNIWKLSVKSWKL